MAKHTTHKRGATGKAQTIARRKVRAIKSGSLTVNRSGRAK